MDGGGEDRISNLPDGVIGQILSGLSTKDAMRTSVLSKDWEYKWTSISNIQLDCKGTSLRRKIKNKAFASYVERVLHLTQNSRIKSFSLSSSIKLDSEYLKRCIARILMRGVQNLEIKTYQCMGNTFVSELYNCRSLTKLKLVSHCTLIISLMKNCLPNLKSLHLGHGVYLPSNEVYNTSKVLLPALEELELSGCAWVGEKSVEINAPALLRFVAAAPIRSSNYLIKIDAPKLKEFQSRDSLDNYVLAAPSVSNAVLDNYRGSGGSLGFRAHAILKRFQTLNYLKLSSEVIKALTKSNTDFPLPCFNRLKQLEFDYGLEDTEMLMKLLQVMPSLESLSVTSMYFQVERLKLFPAGIASRLKVIELVEFGGTEEQIELAKSVLKNAVNLETLFVFVSRKPSMPKIEIKNLLLTSPKSSTRATVVVRGSRTRTQN